PLHDSMLTRPFSFAVSWITKNAELVSIRPAAVFVFYSNKTSSASPAVTFLSCLLSKYAYYNIFYFLKSLTSDDE
ncbi:MAG: hypothetical protein IJI09_09785, partial [Clostridia bacterium]|nr:hypothetical protein [Clostridia bacterium]